MVVSDVMSRRVVSINSSAPVSECAKLMSGHNIGAVPIVDSGQIKGILTDRDIVLRCVAEGKDPKQMKINDIMSTNTVSVTPQQSIDDVADIMAAEQIRRVPVIENGKISGMVSIADLARLRHGVEVADAISEISKP